MAARPVSGGRIKFKNAIEIYDLLESRSEPMAGIDLIEYGYPAKKDEILKVYRGYSSIEAEKELRILPSSISHAMSLLKAMNAITLIIAGGPGRKSLYILHYKPTQEQYEEFTGRSIQLERKIAPNRYDGLINDMTRLREQMAELQRRVTELEGLIRDGHNVRGSQTLS